MGDREYIIAIVAVSLLGILTHFNDQRGLSDETEYIKAAEFFRTGVLDTMSPFTLRLLVPFIVSTLPLGTVSGFLLLNSMFWIATALLLYFFVAEVYKDRKIAFYAAAMFAASPALLIYAVRPHVDVGSYFFIMAGIYAIYRFRDSADIAHGLIIAALIALAVMAKETSAFLLIVFWGVAFTRKERAWNGIFLVTVASLAAIIAYQVAVGDTYISHQMRDPDYIARNMAPSEIPPRLGTIAAAFSVGWAFAYLGYVRETGKRKRLMEIIFASSIPVQIASFITAAYGVRVTMLFFPALLPMAALGMAHAAKKLDGTYLGENQWIVAFLMAYFIASNLIALPFVEFANLI